MKRWFTLLLALIVSLSLSATALGTSMVGQPNPVRESSAEAILETLGFRFTFPRNVENIRYSTIDAIAQAQFTWIFDGEAIPCCARMTYADEWDDISGMYFDWTRQASFALGWCDAELNWIEGEQGIVLWYDIAPGILYSVSVDRGATEAMLVALARRVYEPAQHEVDGDIVVLEERDYTDQGEYVRFTALDVDDRVVWTFESQTSFVGQLDLIAGFRATLSYDAGEYYIVYNGETGITALDMTTGAIVWAIDAETCPVGGGMVYALDPIDAVLYVGGFDGLDPVALDVKTGAVRWIAHLDQPDIYGLYELTWMDEGFLLANYESYWTAEGEPAEQGAFVKFDRHDGHVIAFGENDLL